ncbi:helix-turn-helix transcriptional regulator [Oricola sp.]|uniref:helix-turn-helix transcriptional regulator n=1 Tax=Oricola sp. TaxID=1979950 RepID=UPI003BA9B759
MSYTLISIQDTCRKLNISRTVLWRLVKNGEFPRPVAVSGKRKSFVESEVDAWIAARIDARDMAEEAV